VTIRRAPRAPASKFTAEAERAAFAAWKGGDAKALDTIVRALRPHVVALSKRYARMGILPAEDLESEGWIGMVETLQRWDPERGCRILTFAARRMRWHMRIAIVRAMRLVAIPVSAAGVASVFGGEATKVKSSPAILAHVACGVESSIAMHDGGEDGERAPQVCDDMADDPESIAIAREQRDERREDGAWALAQLAPLERDILESGVMADAPERRASQAKRLNLSRHSVIEIETRALVRLRVLLEGA
jgi:RNA polymerase sigma-32 factor